MSRYNHPRGHYYCKGDHCKPRNEENKSPSSAPNFSKLPIHGDDPFRGS